MKHLKIAFLGLLMVCFTNTNAQDKNNLWAVGLGINAVDFYPANAGGMLTPQGNSTVWYDEFFNANDHYNITPIFSRLTVSRYINKGFSAEFSGSFNKIEKIGDTKVNDLSYLSLSLAAKYDLNNIIGETSWFDPYAVLGGSYNWIDSDGNPSADGGLGANVWLSKKVALNIESRYKHVFAGFPQTQHFQHSLGVVFKFGSADTDKDGIPDNEDACPEVFGVAAFNGCPDSDNDGVADSEDECPNVAGSKELKGCPDTDGDGVADKDDACPTEKGTKANKGCPDTDGDGVVDKDDACPTVAGAKENKGCPWPDADGDGVADKDDKCPNEAGTASNNGCPEMSAELKALLEGKTVYFNVAQSSLKKEGKAKLDEIAEIMKKHSDINYSISTGYTDSDGGEAYNQRLSEARANTVKKYLVSKGIPASNITAKGEGKANPIAPNTTAKGKAENRRVEIKLAK